MLLVKQLQQDVRHFSTHICLQPARIKGIYSDPGILSFIAISSVSLLLAHFEAPYGASSGLSFIPE